MANIKINEINTVGSELLLDSESFLNELSGEELNNFLGADGPYETVYAANCPPETFVIKPWQLC